MSGYAEFAISVLIPIFLLVIAFELHHVAQVLRGKKP